MSFMWPVLLAFVASFVAYAMSEIIREADKVKGGLGGLWWTICFLFFAVGAGFAFLAMLSLGFEEVVEDPEVAYGVKLLSFFGTLVSMYTTYGFAWLVIQGVAGTSWFREKLCPAFSV